jgi:hypothetical protein
VDGIRPPSKKALVLLLGLGLAVALLLMPFPPSWRGLWQEKLQDLGHLPLFAGLTLLLWICVGPASRAGPGRSGEPSRTQSAARLAAPTRSAARLAAPTGLLWSVLIAIGIAGLAEIVQGWVGRTMGLGDFLRGSLAALATGAVIAGWQWRRYPLRVVACLLVAAALLAWPLVDGVPYLVDAYQGARAFPVLADFATQRQLLRWRTRQASLTRVEADPPATWEGRLEFFPGPHPYSYGAVRPILRDFSDYRWLCYSFSVLDKPVELVISLRSGSGEPGVTTHYQEQKIYAPGSYQERLDLTKVAPRADPLPLDLSDLWIIQFFLVRPQEPHTILLQRLWLEKGSAPAENPTR